EIVVIATDNLGNESNASTDLVVITPEEEDDEPALQETDDATTLPITDLDQPGEILGDQDDQANNNDENTTDEDENATKEEDSDVAGAIDEDEDGNMTLFGLAWYWWLLVIAGVLGAWYLLGAWRNRNEE